MKQLQDLIDSGGTYNNYERERGLFYYVAIGIAGSGNDKVRINGDCGHRSNIVPLCRNEWCLMSDLI